MTVAKKGKRVASGRKTSPSPAKDSNQGGRAHSVTTVTLHCLSEPEEGNENREMLLATLEQTLDFKPQELVRGVRKGALGDRDLLLQLVFQTSEA